MQRRKLDGQDARQVDEALANWRQGDAALEERSFVHVADGSKPVTDEATAADSEGLLALTTEVAGLVVVTQTCDLIRSCTTRPFAEVSPLVQVDERAAREIERGRRPAYAIVPSLRQRGLVADLDRVMTVEKPVIARWGRTAGCETDEESRRFASDLARKRARFAFPDDFVAFVERLQRRIGEKHGKESDEGRALRSLREIRVMAIPSWSAHRIRVHFWFLKDDADPTFEGRSWDDLLESWLKLVPPNGRFGDVDGVVATLDDISGRDLVSSDLLDLDRLSRPELT